MHSDVIKKGIERAPHRALLRALGLTDAEMRRPFVGVINSFSEIIPGHLHLRSVAEAVKAGIRMGGGTPFECNTIAICDGLAMGRLSRYSEQKHHRKSWNVLMLQFQKLKVSYIG